MGFMGKRILFVDDEVDMRGVYKKTLEKAGYQVQTAKDGHDALQKMDGFKPDLVVLDIMMPDMDGWAAAKKIRETHSSADLPIIMLTVKGEIEDKVKSIEEVGANRHLTKPIDSAQLISTIKALLNEL